MAFKVKVTDRGLDQFLSRLSGSSAVKVGVQGSSGSSNHGGEKTVTEVAAQHELGLGVPERSWLRGWIDENQAVIQKTLQGAAKASLQGKVTLDAALDASGLKFVGLIQKRIAEGITPPNTAATIRRKGSSTPLIDTGQFRSSITRQVIKWTGQR